MKKSIFLEPMPSIIQRFSDLCEETKNLAYLIPRRDPFFLHPSHGSTDIIHTVTGFTGSSAYLLLTEKQNFLYVDSRYTLQATSQCPEVVVIECSHPLEVLPQQLNPGATLMISPWVWTVEEGNRYQKIAQEQGWYLVMDHAHSLDPLIFSKKSSLLYPIKSIPNPEAFQEKCGRVFTQEGQSQWILTQAQDIAWLTNMRGGDHSCSPFFNAYLLVSKEEDRFSGVIYTALPRCVEGLDEDLQVRDFNTLWRGKGTESLSSEALEALDPLEIPLVYDPKYTPVGLVRAPWIRGSFSKLHQGKSEKNSWERDHVTQCHVKDGVALTRFLYWLSQLPPESEETEWSAAEKLASLRAEETSYQGPSFPTISAMGDHGAMMHYVPTLEHHAPLQEGLYLVDSGGQYHFGTTDVTRTLWLGQGEIPRIFKERYTQVLQAHIHLSQMIFPKGTNGMQLDAIARSFLWQRGWDYAHSTGHGVAAFGDVHEAPPRIAPGAPRDPIMEHMVFSVEPGYYEENWGGIRLENLVLVKAHEEHKLSLEPLTLAPFALSLILREELSLHHRQWLDAYHKKVYETLSPLLEERVRLWLWTQTHPC